MNTKEDQTQPAPPLAKLNPKRLTPETMTVTPPAELRDFVGIRMPAARPTPITDDAAIALHGTRLAPGCIYVKAEDMRNLERQLSAVTRERDELAAKFTKLDKPKYSGLPMLDEVLAKPNPEFSAWVASLPATYWTRYDLSAARIGWEAAKTWNQKP